MCRCVFVAISLLSPCLLSSPLSYSPSTAICFLKKDEPGRGRTCNLQIRSLTRFHCATGPSYSILLLLFYSHSYPDRCHIYPFLTLSLVGSYQVGYTRSHPNTEVKMLRACSVPLCSHRWERQVIYLFIFFIFLLLYTHYYLYSPTVFILLSYCALPACTVAFYFPYVFILFFLFLLYSFYLCLDL